MKIAIRTALTYGILTAGILFVFAYGVILISKENQKEEFFDRLGYKITWRAEFYFDVGIDENMVHFLHIRNKKILNEADISIYNSDKKLIFSDINLSLDNKVAWKKLDKGITAKWTQDHQQYMGVVYTHKNKKYYIFGRAKDVTGEFYIHRLIHHIKIIYVISVLVVFGIGFLFSYYTLKPLKEIINQIRDISEHQLSHRLKLSKTKDEIYELSETFNITFNRLEKSFNTHKNFVYTISHELRTPLSALIAELQLAKELNETLDEYKQSIDNALSDAEKATNLSTALLDLARANYDISQVTFVKIRLDEILIDAKLYILNKNLDYKINVSYDNLDLSEFSNDFEFIGNQYLMHIAFANLIENACKYSNDRSCKVSLSNKDNLLTLEFTDNGIGIPKDEQDKVFDLFFRGKNKNFNQGNGIGLSIVQQIINLHKGSIELISEENIGSSFIVKFKKEQ
ncbi:HAMP domain-containing sensor histidine kinase [Empedobacter falsenii]|uniref:HAMP domain-containing sensor histidine kinase n=1 Tax=Empedobacter falsenii TaxID=343874 RepID=UPI001C8D809C|nr:HAMP domain-containing sensor histidine kinase [Empedobacter falsenii]MBY0068256.1 HAMP domain-containing histidine kinase [Empedobacter falsenii]